jgi:fused signal recognition particle receptor
MSVVEVGLILVLVALAVVVGFALRRSRAASRPPASAPLGGRLARSSAALGAALKTVLGSSRTEEMWQGVEDALVASDVGVAQAAAIVAQARHRRPSPEQVPEVLRSVLEGELAGRDRALRLGEVKPAVILVVGVNGVGKTTTIAKLAHRLAADGRVPLLAAADTFRAAADTQLRTWGERLGVDVVGGQEGADPAAVAHDAYAAARARGRDVVLVDTAGRLHSRHNLMAELAKIRRVLDGESGGVAEVLLVLDATGGQNAIAQVAEFTKAVGVTGIVLTKLDGTARGGVVLAVEKELGVPVKLIGLGEGLDDLVEFEPEAFVGALLADV